MTPEFTARIAEAAAHYAFDKCEIHGKADAIDVAFVESDFTAGASFGVKLALECEAVRNLKNAADACWHCWESKIEPHPVEAALKAFDELLKSVEDK